MSRTSGEPHIAVSILDSVFRIVFLVLTLFLLYEGARLESLRQDAFRCAATAHSRTVSC